MTFHFAVKTKAIEKHALRYVLLSECGIVQALLSFTCNYVQVPLRTFTCECERSISAMRRLNNYMRCTMGESRLPALALMYIKYDMPVNLDEIVNLFEGPHPRMMQFTSLVYDYQQIE